MKIAIGDLIDRYTICKLKSERGKIDNSKEIEDIEVELKNYQGIESYIDRLYKLHDKIWDFESDIRKGKENILGLEEVGRRSIMLRDMNRIRIEIKNEINSIFNEGYIEVKVDHGSEIKTSLVISLTTVPERLIDEKDDGIKLVMTSICEQNDDDYEIHFNIPEIYVPTGERYIMPNWLDEYRLKYPHIKVYRTKDMGPATKCVPTIERITNPETIILVVDDDLVYHTDMISEHRKYQKEYPDSLCCYAGSGCLVPMYPGEHSLRDSWVSCVTQVRETAGVQHYKSASYKRKLFDEDFWKYYVGRTISDDPLISRYFLDKGIKMYVLPYEPENHLFETLELWNLNNRVETFPVLRNSSSVGSSGANNPKLLAMPGGDRFFEPPSLGDRSWENGVDPPRPMAWSQDRGYYYINDLEIKEPIIDDPIIDDPIIDDPIIDKEIANDPVIQISEIEKDVVNTVDKMKTMLNTINRHNKHNKSKRIKTDRFTRLNNMRRRKR